MGTVLINNFPFKYVKRFYGGMQRGVSYSIMINDEFNKEEFKDLLEELHEALEADC